MLLDRLILGKVDSVPLSNMSTPNTAGSTSTDDQPDNYEITLLRRLARGDRQALAEFYDRYIGPVYRFVYHQVGGHQQDAEDVTQETFIAAINNLDSFRGDSRLYVWLCGIAWHKATDLRRRRDNVKTPQLTGDDVLFQLRGASQQLAVEEVAEREFLRRQVWQALMALPEHYRQVLTLKYLEEFTVSEIALLMARSEKAVESLLTRARDAFKAQLDRGNEVQ